jgi:hypothetical protein
MEFNAKTIDKNSNANVCLDDNFLLMILILKILANV